MTSTSNASRDSLPFKRAKLAENLRTHTHRKVLLCLESGVPDDVSWALHGLLLASCPPENTSIVDRSVQPLGRDVLTDTVSLPRNPHLLRVLLPVAVAPAQPAAAAAATALFPCTPGMAHTRALATAQWRQAWLVLRNMSLMSENESPLSQSTALRKLIVRTLRSAFRVHESDPPLAATELGFPGVGGHSGYGGDEVPLPYDPALGQCTLNPSCMRGYRHSGHGGLCRLPRERPSRHLRAPS